MRYAVIGKVSTLATAREIRDGRDDDLDVATITS